MNGLPGVSGRWDYSFSRNYGRASNKYASGEPRNSIRTAMPIYDSSILDPIESSYNDLLFTLNREITDILGPKFASRFIEAPWAYDSNNIYDGVSVYPAQSLSKYDPTYVEPQMNLLTHVLNMQQNGGGHNVMNSENFIQAQHLYPPNGFMGPTAGGSRPPPPGFFDGFQTIQTINANLIVGNGFAKNACQSFLRYSIFDMNHNEHNFGVELHQTIFDACIQSSEADNYEVYHMFNPLNKMMFPIYCRWLNLKCADLDDMGRVLWSPVGSQPEEDLTDGLNRTSTDLLKLLFNEASKGGEGTHFINDDAPVCSESSRPPPGFDPLPLFGFFGNIGAGQNEKPETTETKCDSFIPVIGRQEKVNKDLCIGLMGKLEDSKPFEIFPNPATVKTVINEKSSQPIQLSEYHKEKIEKGSTSPPPQDSKTSTGATADEKTVVPSTSNGRKRSPNRGPTYTTFRAPRFDRLRVSHVAQNGINSIDRNPVFSRAFSSYGRSRNEAQRRNSETGKWCQFCKAGHMSLRECSSHNLFKYREDDGKKIVECPHLRTYVCPLCGETGDFGHTRSYCPKYHEFYPDAPRPRPLRNLRRRPFIG